MKENKKTEKKQKVEKDIEEMNETKEGKAKKFVNPMLAWGLVCGALVIAVAVALIVILSLA